jgi:hypothetical protein
LGIMSTVERQCVLRMKHQQLEGLPAVCRCSGWILVSHLGSSWCWPPWLGECEGWGGEEEKGAAVYMARLGRNRVYPFHSREGRRRYLSLRNHTSWRILTGLGKILEEYSQTEHSWTSTTSSMPGDLLLDPKTIVKSL